MYPIANWKKLKRGYRFKEKTFYSKHHLGLDLIIPTGKKIRAPFKGEVIRQFRGKQGGLTVWFKYKDYIIRFLHNSGYGKKGKVKEGDVIAYSGNTGSLSTSAHSHIDISKNSVQLNNIKNFLDPEEFNWEKNMKHEENFRKIFKYVKSLIEKDYGKSPNDKETKEIKKDLKDIKQTFKLMSAQNIQLRDVATTFDVKINELETARDIQAHTIDELEDRIKNQTAQIGVLEGRNGDLKKELKSKEALISKDAESAGIIKALEFVFRAMMAKIK